MKENSFNARLGFLHALRLFIAVSLKDNDNSYLSLSSFPVIHKKLFSKIIDVIEQNLYSKQTFLEHFYARDRFLRGYCRVKTSLKRELFKDFMLFVIDFLPFVTIIAFFNLKSTI